MTTVINPSFGNKIRDMTPTHYKVVPLNEKPDDPSQLSIPIVSEAGMVTQAFLFDLKMYDPNKWKQLKPVEGILMTEGELKAINKSFYDLGAGGEKINQWAITQ